MTCAPLRASGRSVLVYPEGTRVPPGEMPPLRSGFAGLYKALALPVVPIALDSGRLMPKRGAKHAGVVTIRIGEPIPPGLPRQEFQALAQERLESASNSLVDGGLDGLAASGHPVPADEAPAAAVQRR